MSEKMAYNMSEQMTFKMSKLFCFFSKGREHRDLDIIIFQEVLDTVARVDRVLTTPGGSLLMAGRSGVGRRTAVTLVSHMHQMEFFTPKVSRGYGMKQFKNDLKTVRPTDTFLNLFFMF